MIDHRCQDSDGNQVSYDKIVRSGGEPVRTLSRGRAQGKTVYLVSYHK